MTSRRSFLSGLAAASLIGTQSWAKAGGPQFLSAAADANGQFLLCGLTDQGNVSFEIPLPARGHAGAAHPTRAEAVVFARRPGTFALVLNCITGEVLTRLKSQPGRHFYGHGVFSADGTRLFTTENDYDAARGIIGVWDMTKGYKRVGEFFSGGVGPHDIKLMPDHETLVIANGGIETHPETGRTKLNIPVMEPNLAFIGLTGEIKQRSKLARNLYKNSIRHLAVSGDGLVGFGMQWQGSNAQGIPLVGLVKQGGEPHFLTSHPDLTDKLNGYVGSIAFSRDGKHVAVTSPRGNIVQIYDAQSGDFVTGHNFEDVCGLASLGSGFVVTHASGQVTELLGAGVQKYARPDLRWDNHMVEIA